MKKVVFIVFLILLSCQLALFSADILTIVKKGTVAEVQQAINAGADVNVRDEEGWTPLMLAAWYNTNPDVLSVLINADADVNARTEWEWEWTPLVLAAAVAATYNTNPDVLSVLIKAGSDVNARDVNGMSLLMGAVKYTNPDVLSVLINAGADVNTRDEDGSTPLMYAADLNTNPDVLSVLINAGADMSARDKWGDTAFDYAKNNYAIKGTKVYWKLNDARYKY